MYHMAGREPDLGDTAVTVAENVKLLREAQNMNYTQLSDRLKAVADWSINAVGIRRIEDKERRVTPDDLVALALAFRVSPITLLMPISDHPDSPVAVTGVRDVELSAARVWDWLRAEEPLVSERDYDWMAFNAASWPDWDEFRMLEKFRGQKRPQAENFRRRTAAKRRASAERLKRRRDEERSASDGDD
jgi:transcriptional regulator with XRE-family HTH domain